MRTAALCLLTAALSSLPLACGQGDSDANCTGDSTGSGSSSSGSVSSSGSTGSSSGSTSSGSLGTPGAYFAGTACRCTATTKGAETMYYLANGAGMTGTRSPSGTDCVFTDYLDKPILTLHADGTATAPQNVGADLRLGTGRWTCNHGNFEGELPNQGIMGTIPYPFIIGAPACPATPCEAGYRCTSLISTSLCVADGSVASGARCGENANCASGTCASGMCQ